MSKTMTRAGYNKIVRECHAGMDDLAADMGGEVSDEMYGEIANIELEENPGIADFLKSQGVRDIKGRLADDIYSGRGF